MSDFIFALAGAALGLPVANLLNTYVDKKKARKAQALKEEEERKAQIEFERMLDADTSFCYTAEHGVYKKRTGKPGELIFCFDEEASSGLVAQKIFKSFRQSLKYGLEGRFFNTVNGCFIGVSNKLSVPSDATDLDVVKAFERATGSD